MLKSYISTVKPSEQEPGFFQVSLNRYTNGSQHKFRLFRFLNRFLFPEEKVHYSLEYLVVQLIPYIKFAYQKRSYVKITIKRRTLLKHQLQEF